jgi:hypothetical protein
MAADDPEQHKGDDPAKLNAYRKRIRKQAMRVLLEEAIESAKKTLTPGDFESRKAAVEEAPEIPKRIMMKARTKLESTIIRAAGIPDELELDYEEDFQEKELRKLRESRDHHQRA